MKHLYLFSGLGADHRAFSRLDFDGFEVTHVRWNRPGEGETLTNYARRLVRQITTPEPILIGLSFGGIVAGEVSKIIQAKRLILLASVKRSDELPPYYRWAGTVGLHKILPPSLLLTPNRFASWLFGVSASADRRLLADILRDTDPVFLRWAMNVIVRWRGATAHPYIYHIHGSSDRILPCQYVKADATIAGGGHLMTLTKAEEVGAILRRHLMQS